MTQATNVARSIYGCPTAVLAYSKEAFSITSSRANISLMPLNQCISYDDFIRELEPKIRGVPKDQRPKALCILRQGLCTGFMQKVEYIFRMGIRGIFCYDNSWQMFGDKIQMFDFTGVIVERRKLKLSEAPTVNFAPIASRTSNTKIGAVNPITALVREVLDEYPIDLPACIIAEDMVQSWSTRVVKMHEVARVIRRERGQEGMEHFPLLHELVLWTVKTKEFDVNDESIYPSILSECAAHIPAGSYLNVTNIRKVVNFIIPRLNNPEPLEA